MTVLASPPAAGETWFAWALTAAAALACGLLVAGPVLRRRHPAAW